MDPGGCLAPLSLLTAVVGLGLAVQHIFHTAGVHDLGRGAAGNGHSAAGAHGVRDKGQGFGALFIQQQRTPAAVQRTAGRLAGSQLIPLAVGQLQGLPVIAAAGGGQHHALHGAADIVQIAASVLLVSPQQVQEQPGRLAPGQGGVSVGAHAVGQANGGAHGHVAVRPHAAHVLVLVAQQPQQDGDGLPHGDGPLRVELAVGIAGDDGLAFCRHVDERGSPVRGLHIREHRNRAIQSQLALTVHGVDRHFAELRPVELCGGAEAAVAVTVQHTHQPQGLHRRGSVPVRNIRKADGIRRGGRHGQQGRRHTYRQQQRENSLFHICFPPYSARRASTGWSFDAFAAG